ncbi:hypothetical protein ABPG74_000117 [Tetrahymena malaccensis]
MGSCVNKPKPKPQAQVSSSKLMSGVLTKQEQLLFKNSKNSTLKFNVKISNIKAKNLPVSESQVMIIFASIKNKIKTGLIRDTKNPHWKINEEFDFICEADKMKNLLFDMFVQDEAGNVISKITLTLYQIATGPVHNDFLLNTQDLTRKGRITFDIRMAQFVTMNISCKNMFCTMDENLQDKAYNFNLKVKSHDQDYESDHSPNFINPTYAFSHIPLSEEEKQGTNKKQLNKNEVEDTGTDIADEGENFNMTETQEFAQRKAIPKSIPTKKKQKDKKRTVIVDVLKGKDSFGGKDSAKNIGSTESFKLKGVKSQIGKSGFQNIASQSFKKDGMILSDTNIIYQQQQIDTSNINSTFEQLLGHKEASWEFVDQHDQFTPSIDFEILADEFSQSSFELLFWAVTNPEIENDVFSNNQQQDQIGKASGIMSKSSFRKSGIIRIQSNVSGGGGGGKEDKNNEIYVDYKLLGNGYVSMIRFLSQDVGIKIERDQVIISEISIVDMKIWNQGKQVGIWKGQFIVTNQPFIRQLVGGVRTENGVTKATQLYIQKENLTTQQSLPREFKNIMQCKLQIEENIIKLYDKSITLRERYKINDEIKAQLKRIIQYLHVHSSAESPNLYKNEEELIRAQSILIEVAKHLLEYADQVDEILRELYYETLILINNREELDLSYMGFDRDQKEQLFNEIMQIGDIKKMENDENQPTKAKKVRICLTYEGFLYHTLEKVLQKLDQKGFNDKERQFVENFSALAFFRITAFREKLITCILDIEQSQSQKKDINNWVQDQIIIDEAQADKKNKFLMSLFEWEQDFYRYLQNQSRHIEHKEQLKKTLERQNWQKRFQKKGLAFFLFVGEWCQYIQKLPNNYSTLTWSFVPGFVDILRAFLYEIQKRDTKSYPEALKTTSFSLLQHDEIINIYLRIIYAKTNIYDSTNVFNAFEMIDQWFKKMIEMQKRLPVNFDYAFFFRGIKLVLEGDHAVSISKALWLLTNCFQLLPITQKRDILKVIFSNMFFKLFMHWSPNVRSIFHNFLLYRVNHLHRSHKTQNKLDTLKKDFMMISQKKQIKNQEEMNNIMNEMIYSDYTRMIAILEEANKRLTKQLKKNELFMAVKNNAKTLKMKYFHKKNQMKKKYIRDKMKGEGQNSEVGLNNSVIESLDLSIITRKDSIQSMQSIGRHESNFSGLEFLKSQKDDDKSDQNNQNENGDQDQSNNSIDSISNLESILSDLNNLSEEENKKKKLNQKSKTARRNSLNAITRKASDLDNNNNNFLNVDNQELNPISRNQTTISKNNKKEIEKILQNEIKQKQKILLKKQVQKKYPNQQSNKGGIKVYRRYRDQDEAQEKLRIPKDFLKYLPESWEEFDTSKKEYNKWLQNWYKELYSNEDLTEEEVLQKILTLNIPEICVKIPKDESEGQGTYGANQENDW